MGNLRPGRPVWAHGLRAGALLASGALVLSGCTGHPFAPVIHAGALRAADVALVRFTSCGDALRNLRAAAGNAVGPGGFAVGIGTAAGAGSASTAGTASGGSAGAAPDAGVPAAAPAAANQVGAGQGAGQVSGGAAPGSYSGTNTAEAGVDEPDLVKTDGRRIVTVTGGVLRVVDAGTQQLTGVLDLSAGAGLDGATPANLLLSGDHALVLFDQSYPVVGAPVPDAAQQVSPSDAGGPVQAGGTSGPGRSVGPGAPGAGPVVSAPAVSVPIIGPRLVLVELSAGTPQVISEYTMDGALAGARQVGSVVRIVVHSAPRVVFPPGFAQSAQARTEANRAVIAQAMLSAWLPRYALTVGNIRRTGQVDCAATSHPVAETYSGTSMLTVLTFDLSGDSLDDGQPVTVVADGDTVYSNGSSLYIANDRQWSLPPADAVPPPGAGQGARVGTAQDQVTAAAPATATAAGAPALPQQYTGLYKFDISGPGRPVYEASGTVPGWLLGSSGTAQYAMSAWDGALRVATTTAGAFAGWSGQPTQSAVYVLEQAGGLLVTIGKVSGLGQGEQIYAVRFAGPVGYVVTFRQTDPLYTLDLSDPARPRVVGELLLSGYSAYLDPVEGTHLIGIGQDANAQGQAQGTQISLFDVSDLAAPVRLAVYHLRSGHSEAEFDPHAFLYWPASRLLVIPVQLPPAVTSEPTPGTGSVPQSATAPLWPVSKAIVLHVGDHTITRLGTITPPPVPAFPADGQIRRSLITGATLWTLSDTGLKANDLATLAPLGWVPFGQ
jgi:Beta propeller domain